LVPKKSDRLDDGGSGTTWSIHADVLRITVHHRASSPVIIDIVRILEDRMLDGLVREPVRAIVDIRGAAFSPSGQEIRLGALRLADLRSTGRIGLLVADDFQYGLVRMLGLLAAGSGFDVQPFRDPDEAGHWLRPR
jgi:hypothetical protein